MNDKLDIAVLQSPGELDGSDKRLDWLNTQFHKHDIAGSDLLILPELFQCGYNTPDTIARVAEPSDGPFAQQIRHLAKTHDLAIAYGYAERTKAGLYNSAQCIDKRGQTVGHHRKLLLPPGFEPSIFIPGQGYEVFKLGEFRLSILICYDIEFPENMRHVAAAGAELVIAPTALAKEWGVVSEKLIPTRAFENGVFVAYANHCGFEIGKEYYGGSCIVAPDGHELARADNLACISRASITKSGVQDAQMRMPYLTERFRLP
ncbi:MAG: carbon-nitrogen hydrolase family protein [Granulosicoccus sp.]